MGPRPEDLATVACADLSEKAGDSWKILSCLSKSDPEEEMKKEGLLLRASSSERTTTCQPFRASAGRASASRAPRPSQCDAAASAIRSRRAACRRSGDA